MRVVPLQEHGIVIPEIRCSDVRVLSEVSGKARQGKARHATIKAFLFAMNSPQKGGDGGREEGIVRWLRRRRRGVNVPKSHVVHHDHDYVRRRARFNAGRMHQQQCREGRRCDAAHGSSSGEARLSQTLLLVTMAASKAMAGGGVGGSGGRKEGGNHARHARLPSFAEMPNNCRNDRIFRTAVLLPPRPPLPTRRKTGGYACFRVVQRHQ